MKYYLILLIPVYSLIPHYVFTQDIEVAPSIHNIFSSLSQEKMQQLLQEKGVSHISKIQDKSRLLYTPKLSSPLFDDLVTFVTDQKPHILYESLYFFPETNQHIQDELMVILYNLISDVEVFATVKYTNIKDGNVHPVFKESYRVTSMTDTTPLSAFPPISEIVVRRTERDTIVNQDMPPFGYVLSKYQYAYHNLYGSFEGYNISPIKYKLFTAVKPANMLTAAWAIRTQEGILVYGIGAVRIAGILGVLKNVLENSFVSRMIGLFEWMKTEVSIRQLALQTQTLALPTPLSDITAQ